MRPIKIKSLNYVSPLQNKAENRLWKTALFLTIGLLIIIVLLISKGV